MGNAWLQCNQIPTPGLDEIPISRSEAYFVQDQMAEVIGDSVSGWKVGATSTKMRELDGHDDVIPGRIFESVTFLGAKQNLPISRFMDARAEPNLPSGFWKTSLSGNYLERPRTEGKGCSFIQPWN